MSKAIPIATADYRAANEAKIQRYVEVANKNKKEITELQEANRFVFWEGFAFGIATTGVLIWWIL